MARFFLSGHLYYPRVIKICYYLWAVRPATRTGWLAGNNSLNKENNRGKHVQIRTLPALLLLVPAFLASCSPSEKPAASGKLIVVCTTGMITDAAKIIGGGHVEVTGLCGPGVDPHLYLATRADQKRLNNADLVLYHGIHLEGKMGDLLARIKKSPRKDQHISAVADVIDKEKLIRNKLFGAYPDPHLWFDLQLWKIAVTEAGKALQGADPDHSESYASATKNYLEKIEETHQWALARTAELPPEKRKVVTSHDAYNYFARAYGFEVKGLQGISTETKPGLQNIRAAVKYIRENGISVIFAETSVPRNAVEKVAQEAGCEIFEHELYSDALGKPGSQADSFLGMFRFNLETILTALGNDRGKGK